MEDPKHVKAVSSHSVVSPGQACSVTPHAASLLTLPWVTLKSSQKSYFTYK